MCYRCALCISRMLKLKAGGLSVHSIIVWTQWPIKANFSRLFLKFHGHNGPGVQSTLCTVQTTSLVGESGGMPPSKNMRLNLRPLLILLQ